MSRRNLNAVVRYLQQLTGSAGANGASDAELLERYVRYRDEAAFELLIWRHGTLVFNVCRRILPREQDAEDAFQATFLAFVRKASSISSRGSVASWLYKVAFRVALEAKEQTRKTAAMEKPGGELLAVQPASDPLGSDVRPILDAELNQLPERLRRPIILCYLEGKSNEEAARELGCRLGTIYSRLSRGREILRQRLQRRGVTLSVTGLMAALTASAAEAAPAIPLMRSAVRAALVFADSSAASVVSPRVTTLAEGVLRTMFVTKLKIAAVMLLVLSLAAGGVWTQAHTAAPQAEAKAEDPPPKPKAGDEKAAEPIPVKVVKPKKGGMPLMVTRSGEVVAAQQQQVVPLVSGTVKEVLVDIGDRVKKGQTLLVLDAPLLGKEVEQAMAALEIAKAQLEEAEAQMVMAKAEVESAKADLTKAKVELSAAKSRMQSAQELADTLQRQFQAAQLPQERVAEAKQKVQVARAQIQLAESGIDTAEAEVQVKMGKLALARAAVKRAHANVNSSQSTVDKARIQDSFTQLKAAFDGVVTRRTIDAGNFVQSSDSRLLRPLVTVQRIDTLRIVVAVPDRYAPLIERGLPVEIGRGRESKISRFSPSLEGGNREMTVEIDVPNAENRLLPGMIVVVGLPLVKTSLKSLIVPNNCLMGGDSEETFVYIVREGKAYRKVVTLGVFDGRNLEITKGIQASDLVITDPSKLKHGTPVKIEKAP